MSARFASVDDFKQSLEARIRKDASARGLQVQPLRQRRIFDRFLARVSSQLRDAVVLKGGAALALRIPHARMTRDVDVTLRGHPGELLAGLQAACRLDLGDYLQFEAIPHPRHPTIDGEGVVYEGRRFQIRCTLAGNRYGDPFGLDVAFGDRMVVPPEV